MTESCQQPALWAALRFPQLAIDLLTRAQPHEPGSIAVVADRRIIACNVTAAALGVRAGQKLSAALALCPALTWRERDPAAEKAALSDIAVWAGQFTSHICLCPPEAMLLEVGGSVRFFGGLGALMRQIIDGLIELGFNPAFGIAPTPQGALILARSCYTGANLAAKDRKTLRQRLLPLPVTALESARGCLTTLEGIGARVFADVLALPRDGLNRRFGSALLDEIDRALGAKPDPRKAFVAPTRFETKMELAYPTASSDQLMFACKRMFDLLEGFLIARRGGVQRLILTFRLDHHPEPAVLVLELLRPSDDALHFTTLLRERLNRKQLEAPAEHITLTADQVIPLFERALSLFPDDPQHSDGLPKLLERLHARLGDGALRGLRAVPDHRPECASLTPKLLDEVGGKTAAAPDLSSPRPFWLLATPQALREVGSIPHYEGPLTLLAGPERIESGWWDGDAARDYFIAATPEQAQVWIFRDRKAPTGWFLHGFFA